MSPRPIRVTQCCVSESEEAALRAYCGGLLRRVREARHRSWCHAQRQAGLPTRTAAPWSQTGLAKRLGTSKSTVSKVERGERWPLMVHLLQHAALLQVPLARLFPARPHHAEAALVAAVLAAPPEVHDVIRALLAMQCLPTPVQHAEVS